MVPVASDDATRVRLADFCGLLGKLIGAIVLPHRAPSPLALASAVHAGRVHIAWLSPTLLASSPLVAEAVPVAASVREGVASYHSVLFVAAASTIVSPRDLRGSRVAWVAPTSAGGYVFPRIALARAGYEPSTIFASERFYDSHARVADAVLSGDADVGATFATFRDGDPNQPMVNAGFPLDGRLRVIDHAGPIPSDVIATTPDLAATLRAALVHALHDLSLTDTGRNALQSLFSVQGFQPFASTALGELRALLAAGRDLGVLGPA